MSVSAALRQAVVEAIDDEVRPTTASGIACVLADSKGKYGQRRVMLPSPREVAHIVKHEPNIVRLKRIENGRVIEYMTEGKWKLFKHQRSYRKLE